MKLSKSSNLRSNCGYTFIELLVAITILGLMIPPVFGLFTNSYLAITSAGQQTAAINLCLEKMESVKSAGYDDLKKNYISSDSPLLNEEKVPGWPQFRRETKVTFASKVAGADNMLPPELLQVQVTVYWTIRDKEHSETLKSYLSKR